MLRVLLYLLFKPNGKISFVNRFKNDRKVVLDVGCGNDSVKQIKSVMPNCYYIGVDIGDYNLSQESKNMIDDYHLTTAELFHEEIDKIKNVDIAISSHNLEHCNHPEQVLEAIANALNNKGVLYLSFPCEESVNFPHRKGTLNFYDDSTHQNIVNWDNTLDFLTKKFILIKNIKNNRPFIMRIIGQLNEFSSKKNGMNKMGTWEYYGFESIIWAKKK